MKTESEQRQSVITEAETWLRTPHHNGARIKGVGVDCGQFPLAVYEGAGLLPHIDPGRYSPQFHLNKDEEWYLKLAMKFGRELPDGEIPKKGDFAIYKVGRCYSHGAIVIDWPLIIHSYLGTGVTFDHGDKSWMTHEKNGKPRAVKFFTLW